MDNTNPLKEIFSSGSEHLLINPNIVGSIPRTSLNYNNPVLAGDFPDPSVVRVGDEYWAVATSSEWAPHFPIFHSKDLINWQMVGSVFSEAPEWSVSNYWAPEISYYQGKFYIYYSARKKDGPISVAVAISDKGEGPYTDYGPIVAQEAGSIDGIAALDENGERYLIWKEDGNSRNLKTPLWAQKLSENGTKVIGEKHEIIRNDELWEDELVEGHSIIEKNGWFYMFYSGSSCCGHGCKYATGVARSRKLLGPWEKCPDNPILKGNDIWKCPGHGTVVTDTKGRYFFLYHAYNRKDSIYIGRQCMLDEIKWVDDEWPTINNGYGPSSTNNFSVIDNSLKSFNDNFSSEVLKSGWQWPNANKPKINIIPEDGGVLQLSPTDKNSLNILGASLARSTTTGDYTATTSIDTSNTIKGTYAGLCLYGDNDNAVGIALINKKIIVWERKNSQKNEHEVISETAAPDNKFISLRMTVKNGYLLSFSFSDDYNNWYDIGLEINGSFLPPWDRGVRIALTAGGTKKAKATFNEINIVPLNHLAEAALLEAAII